jgi:DNA helicase-2/ATP-dependent DNA helicase PcrA
MSLESPRGCVKVKNGFWGERARSASEGGESPNSGPGRDDEWDVVHVIHAADGMIPSDMATGSDEEIEEERRLLYVAMTRPRDELRIYFPLRYYYRRKGRGDAHSYAQLSRFLARVDDGLLERRSAKQAQEEEKADTDVPAGEAGSVDEMLKRLWSD